ncbi:Predicted adenosine kinase [gamma proteobacterium HdN1]|nr:Predicted adenosine kinase [gamma proteobacterium HdN1]
MKKYNVYGIGNALVDMEFHVDDAFLETMAIEKGVMTLVSSEQQRALYQALQQYQGTRAGGGSAANTIIAVSHFGGQAFYSCKVANDEAGDFYVAALQEAGVDTNLHREREEGVSGKCIVMVTPDAERTMHTCLEISEQVSVRDLNHDALTASEFVYLEGYLVTSPSAREAAIRLRERATAQGVRTALTFSDPNMVRFFKEGLQEMAGAGIDLLFCNEQEALGWTGAHDVHTASEALRAIAKEFVITLGKKGALVYDGTQSHAIAATPVRAIDTNGAGDMFAGAYMYALTHGFSAQEAGQFAVRASGQLVTHIGPRLPPAGYKSLLPVVARPL